MLEITRYADLESISLVKTQQLSVQTDCDNKYLIDTQQEAYHKSNKCNSCKQHKQIYQY
jgi:hypothetical protein